MITFCESDHTYWDGDRRVPGVTSVIDLFARTYAGIGEDVLRSARERGTAVHLACQYDDEGDLDEEFMGSELGGYVQAWRQFKETTQFTPDLIEEKVFNNKYHYAGMLDRTGVLYAQALLEPIPVKCLLDIKTGSALHATTGIQTAAYAEALRADRRKKALPRYGVELHADGTWKLEHFDDPDDFPTFLAALRLYNWRNAHV